MEPVLLGAWRGAGRGVRRGTVGGKRCPPPGARAFASTPREDPALVPGAPPPMAEKGLSQKRYGMELLFAGTGAMAPTPERGVACTILRNEGELWMFDCGEGAQINLIHSAWGFQTLTKVFITHLHGDHVLGLPGLLMAMAHAQQSDGSLRRYLPRHVGALEIYGPPGLYKFLKSCKDTFGGHG